MGARRLVCITALVIALAAGGCSNPPAGSPTAAAPPPPAAVTPLPAYPSYPVGVRVLDLHRGQSRPLPTLVFYPALADPAAAAAAQPTGGFLLAARQKPKAQTGAARAEVGLPPAAGYFPLVLFSHGLSGSPDRYAPALADFAAAGFIVAAPTFPHTSEFTTHFRRADIVNQPDDARFVLSHVLRLNDTPSDPLWHRINVRQIAAVGHSAGGYTTTGLFTAGHDPRLRAGVVMAGWAAPGAFAGPPARMLFLQGSADPVVPRTVSWAAWNRILWPKAYVLLRRNSHSTYMQPGDLGYATMHSLVTDFLRWTLNGDEAAHRRLPRMVTKITEDTQLAHR
jgi:dienelactone hydrolase